jgi:pilus assembly protein FimV
VLLPVSVGAAGLGKVTVQSALGQPLRAEVEISSVQPGEADTFTARMAPSQAFRDAGIEINPALASIKLVTERRPEGRHVVVLTSVAPINEPFLDLLIELSSSTGRLIREYTFLLDPPEYKGPQAVTPPVAPAAPPVARVQPVEPARQPEIRPRVEEKAPTAPVIAPKAKEAATYQVKRGDTLVKIAGSTKPDGVTLQQMLIALYRGNKDAFDGDNINRLRAGRILNVPDKDAASAVDQKDAQRLVIAQSQDFNEYRRKMGGAVAAGPAQGDAQRRSSGGKITPQGEDKPLPAKEQKDQLKLSKADSGKAGSKPAAEDLIAKDKALKEASERVADLEKNVKDLQKALELANKSMADLQKQAQAKAPTPAPAPVAAAPVTQPAAKADVAKAPTPAPAPAPVVAPDASKAAAPAPAAAAADVAKAPAAPAATAPEAAKASEPAKVAEAPKAAPAKAAPKAAAKAPPPPPPSSFVDELLDDPAMLGGAGAVLVGLLGYGVFAYRKKRKSQFENSVMGASTPMDSSSVFGSSGGQNIDTGSSQFQTDFSQGGVGTIDTDEVDPIAEADVYMAYGRDAQAEEILKEALTKDPSRHIVTAKLLEIYAARKDLKAFEATASGLIAATGGQGAEAEKAIALGLSIDPGNALYGGAAGVSAAQDAGATAAIDAAAQPDIALEASPAEEPAAPGIDFDLGAPAEAAAPAQPDVALDVDITAAQADDAPIDLGFDLGTTETPASASAEFSPEATQVIGAGSSDTGNAAAPALDAPMDAGLDISFDLPDSTPAAAAEAPPAESGLSGASIDFDLALGEPEKPAEAAGAAPLEMDLSSISFDLGTPGEPAVAPVGDARWQEVATKLDLAKAYEEMGDKDGARDLLKEVMKEGDGAQQQQAQTLLAALE